MTRTIVIGAALASAAACAASLSPERIAKEIASRGAQAVVERLTKDGDYDRVLGHIDSGDGSWVALAPKLAPGADAGNAEALVISLAFALPNNPGAVLSILSGKDGFAPEDVCSAPFIEGTVRDIAAYVRKAEAAVSRVTDPGRQAVKAACLAQLRKS
jgi:hypothetical protein